MNSVRFLLKNVNLLNIILIASVVFMINYTILPLWDMKTKYTTFVSKKMSNVMPAKEEDTSLEKIPSPADFTIVAEQNLFHPERIIPPEKKADAHLPIPEFVLYGTLIADDVSLAFMEDRKSQSTTPGRGKRQVTLKKGNTLSGFTLKEIDPDKVVMVRGEETLVVKVMESNVKKDRAVVKTTAAPAQTPAVAGGKKAQRPLTPPARVPGRP